MAKSTAQRVREAEAMHRARGEREVRVWVPADRAEEIRTIAAAMRQAGKDQGTDAQQ
jgi:hypothetical protein